MKKFSRSQKWNFWSFSVLHWDKRSHGQKIAPKYPQMTLKHLSWAYYKNRNHFLAFWGHFGSFGAILGQFLGLNLKLSHTSHVTIQKDRKRSRIPMELVSEVNLMMLRSFQEHLGPFEAFLGLFLVKSLGLNLKLRQKSHVTTQNGPEMTWASSN